MDRNLKYRKMFDGNVYAKYNSGASSGMLGSVVKIDWDAIKQYIPQSLHPYLSSIFYLIIFLIVLGLASIIGMYIMYKLYMWYKNHHKKRPDDDIKIPEPIIIERPIGIMPIVEEPGEIIINDDKSNSWLAFVFHPLVIAWKELKKLFNYKIFKAKADMQDTELRAKLIINNAVENVKSRAASYVKYEDIPDKEVWLEKIRKFLEDAKNNPEYKKYIDMKFSKN